MPNRIETFPELKLERLAVPAGWLCNFAGRGSVFVQDLHHSWNPKVDPREKGNQGSEMGTLNEAMRAHA
jgi:hypothetical protein